MIDEPIHIQIIGLMPNEPIQITATRISSGTKKFKLQSYAKYVADGNGVVDLKKTIPIEGTYQDADMMGLFWSLEIKEEVQGIEETITEKLISTTKIYNLITYSK